MVIKDQFVVNELTVHTKNGKTFNFVGATSDSKKSLIFMGVDEDSTNLYDDVLFLPITNEEFKNHKKQHLGFLFHFNYKDFESISMVGVGELGVKVNMHLIIRRVFFKSRRDGGIDIIKIKDPLHPSMVYTMTGSNEEVGKHMNENISILIDEMTEHYALNDI